MSEIQPPGQDAPFPLTDADRYVLSLTDEEYEYHTWEDLRRIVDANDLSVLKRKPSDLRRYMAWTAETKADLGGHSFTPVSHVPFEDPSDYRVLVNDWPYGFTPGITHIVVWTRTLIPTEPETGNMTPEARKIVIDFVTRYFIRPLGPGGEDRVLWFKNWVAL